LPLERIAGEVRRLCQEAGAITRSAGLVGVAGTAVEKLVQVVSSRVERGDVDSIAVNSESACALVVQVGLPVVDRVVERAELLFNAGSRPPAPTYRISLLGY